MLRRAQLDKAIRDAPRSATLLAFALLAAGPVSSPVHDDEASKREPADILVVVPERTEGGARIAADELVSYLERTSGVSPRIVPRATGTMGDMERLAAREHAGLVIVIDGQELVPDRVAPPSLDDAGEDGFRIVVEERGNWQDRLGTDREGATFVVLAARSTLGKQYAAYELLRRVGVRFYHPEDEWIPSIPLGSLRDRASTPTILAKTDEHGREYDVYRPDFLHRSYSFHPTHPLEHLESFSDANHPIDEARRVNRWIVKNRGDVFRGAGRGVAGAATRALRAAELEHDRTWLGLHRTRSLTLHNQQQGATAQVDPLSDEPARVQIERHVDEALAKADDAVAFGIHFGPTEFTVTPDVETVQWMEWAAQRVLAVRPDLRVLVNSHATGNQPTERFDDLGCPNGTNTNGRGDYYDLPFHLDPRIGVTIHTVMFYPLEGSASVYGQRSFAHKLCLMRRASSEGRPLWYFPEGAWWLGFDNAVPVYLPLYMWSRARDMELIEPLLASRGHGTLEGHRMFNSGQEWGYWQQDYAVGLWHFNVDVRLDEVLGELLDPLCTPDTWPNDCPAKLRARALLHDVIERQVDDFLHAEDWSGRKGGFYAYFAGEDPADDLARGTSLAYRPMRVSFDRVLRFTDAELHAFRNTDLARLERAAAAYAEWAAQLREIEPSVPNAGRHWLAEILDGIEINGLRAAHTHALYQAVLASRNVDAHVHDSPRGLAARRNASLHLSIAEHVLANARTVIARRERDYRYPAAQTHGGGLDSMTARANGTPYKYRLYTKTNLASYWTNREMQVRDIVRPPASMNSVDVEDARARGRTSPQGFSLTSPASALASSVLGSVLPELEWALFDRSKQLQLSTRIAREHIQRLPVVMMADGRFRAEAVVLELPLVQLADVQLRVRAARMHGRIVHSGFFPQISFEGELVLEDVVGAMAQLAGFDRKGAHATLASVFGYDLRHPPEAVPIAGVFTIEQP